MGEISLKEKLEPIEEVNIKIQERICGLNHNFGRKEICIWETIEVVDYIWDGQWINQGKLNIWDDKTETNKDGVKDREKMGLVLDKLG